MFKRTTMFIKAALLMAGFGLIASEGFCAGSISGSVISDLHRNKGDVVVYLKGVKGPVIHRNAVVEQHHLTFIPKVTAIPVGSTVTFTNHDKLYHNVFSESETKKFNLDTYEHGKQKKVTFDKTGTVSVLCKVHPEMAAWVVVTENQYSAVSDKEGTFTIPNVPAGNYEVAIWSEKSKLQTPTRVTVEDGKTARLDVKLGD
jgi:plastocyanin